MTDQLNGQNLYNGNQLTDFRFINLRDLMSIVADGQEWLVDQLIPLNGITCVAGKPKVGKSFIALDLAISIASGEALFGQFEVSQKSVLIISKEDGQLVLKERLNKLRVSRDLNISFCTDQNIFFDDDSHLPRIVQLIRASRASVIIVDSFVRISRGDENSSRSIALVHRVFKHLNDAGVTVIFIHHHGKHSEQSSGSGGDSLRGSSDIYAMIDSLLTLKRINLNTLYVSNDANRHALPIAPFNISFPDFEGDNRSFVFQGFVDGAVVNRGTSQIDMATNDILELLGRSTPMHQNDIARNLTERTNPGYSQTMVKVVLRMLEVDGGLLVTFQQNRKFYSIQQNPTQEAQGPVEVEA